MKTDDLTTLLARTGAVPGEAPASRFARAVASGALAAMLVMALTLGVRGDIAHAAAVPMFWVKLAFPTALAAASLAIAARLSRPGAPLSALPVLLALPVFAVWAMAAAALAEAEPDARVALLFGNTWRSCPFLITALSVPALVAALWALKELAPTRLALAGAAAGLLAGALGALAYALHCPEMDAPFLAVWYLLGMLVPAAAGALLGPALLRW